MGDNNKELENKVSTLIEDIKELQKDIKDIDILGNFLDIPEDKSEIPKFIADHKIFFLLIIFTIFFLLFLIIGSFVLSFLNTGFLCIILNKINQIDMLILKK